LDESRVVVRVHFGLLIRLFEGRRVVKVKGRKRGVIRK
jgi:hypothetical protein